MRIHLVQTTRQAFAEATCPWACKILKVDYGYVCFEDIEDFNDFQRQY